MESELGGFELTSVDQVLPSAMNVPEKMIDHSFLLLKSFKICSYTNYRILIYIFLHVYTYTHLTFLKKIYSINIFFLSVILKNNFL